MPFRRPTFDPKTPKSGWQSQLDEESISTLPDLIHFNALNNPDHVFCLQAESQVASQDPSGCESHYTACTITYRSLEKAVASCSRWIMRNTPSACPGDGMDPRKPIALFLESDIGLFFHLAALLTLGIPVLLISARLGIPSIRHLLRCTGADVLLVSQRTSRTLGESVDDLVKTKTVETYRNFISDTKSSTEEYQGEPVVRPKVNELNRNVLILHSSGTTGLPKPIYMAHRYLLGYAACHQFNEHQNIDWVNLSTLPLYHGFGLLTPCLSLSIGLTACFPPSSIIPAAHSTLDLIRTFECRSLMTVPSIIDGILALPRPGVDTALETLAMLHFVAIGGGQLNPEYGAKLVENNVKLLNHYGVTEIGAIAPIFSPETDYNWRFLRLRTDLGLELHPIPDTPYFRLVGFPCGWSEPFEVQDQLERNPDSKEVEVRVLGRTDDVLVLKTGEKVMPQKLEDHLNRDANIQAAVCVGSGRFEVIVIIQPTNEDTTDAGEMIDYVWTLISDINPSLDSHARVSSKRSIIIKHATKAIPRSDKGSVMRREVCEVFAAEIDNAYASLESISNDVEMRLDPSDIGKGIRAAVDAILSQRSGMTTISDEENLFELGMDSMQAIRLARSLNGALQELGVPLDDSHGKITAEFIYRYSSIRQLVAACSRILSGGGVVDSYRGHDAASEMRGLVDECLERLTGMVQKKLEMPPRHVVLLTGATGTLGTHTLAQLARTTSIKKVVCLIRSQRASYASPDTGSGSENHVNDPLMKRLQEALDAQGVVLTPREWAKIEAVDIRYFLQKTDESDQVHGDISRDIMAKLADELTHICHLAWPMDFKRPLQSFRPHIELLSTLIELALSAKVMQPNVPPIKLLFASSIAVLRYQKSEVGGGTDENQSVPMILETSIQDPSTVTPMGYAEAKWVCEEILNRAGECFKTQIQPIIVRIGQISGPATTEGSWKTTEHIPALVRASQDVGAFPTALGKVSWLPADHAAQSLTEIMLSPGDVKRFLHLENPIRQPMQDISTIMARELGLSRPYTIPFSEWLKRVSGQGSIESLKEFFRDHYQDLSQGSVVLDTTQCRSISKTLRGEAAVGDDLLVQYIKRWRSEGFLK